MTDMIGKVRYLMAESAELRNRSLVANWRKSKMYAEDAERLERRAQRICDELNLGDARYV